MKELKEIIEEVRDTCFSGFAPSDDAILISATNILLSKGVENITANKKSNVGKIVIKNPTAPATEKQLFRLDELNLPYPKEITKGEASKLIEQNPNGSSAE